MQPISALAQKLLTGRGKLAAILAAAANFDDGPYFGESGSFGGLTQTTRKLVVVDVRGLPAIVADQEDAIVEAARMGVGDIGVGAFDPAGQVGAHEQVEDSIDAVGRYALAPSLRNGLGDVVGRRRLVKGSERIEYRRAHVGPLLATLGDAPCGGIAQRVALMKLMRVTGHDGKIGFEGAARKRERLIRRRYG